MMSGTYSRSVRVNDTKIIIEPATMTPLILLVYFSGTDDGDVDTIMHNTH